MHTLIFEVQKGCDVNVMFICSYVFRRQTPLHHCRVQLTASRAVVDGTRVSLLSRLTSPYWSEALISLPLMLSWSPLISGLPYLKEGTHLDFFVDVHLCETTRLSCSLTVRLRTGCLSSTLKLRKIFVAHFRCATKQVRYEQLTQERRFRFVGKVLLGRHLVHA